MAPCRHIIPGWTKPSAASKDDLEFGLRVGGAGLSPSSCLYRRIVACTWPARQRSRGSKIDPGTIGPGHHQEQPLALAFFQDKPVVALRPEGRRRQVSTTHFTEASRERQAGPGAGWPAPTASASRIRGSAAPSVGAWLPSERSLPPAAGPAAFAPPPGGDACQR